VSKDYPDDLNKTIFIPRPGGRGPAASATPPSQPPPLQQPPPPVSNYNVTPQQAFIASGVNPLVSAAPELIALPAQLLSMVSHNDVDGLRKQTLQELMAFENKARMLGINPETINTCRYVLCAVIDEAALNTVWGSNSAWANQSLLSTLHNDVSGGETFFVILDGLLRDPNANIDLMELMFICISLGFKGRYAVMNHGQEKLEELKNILFEQIRQRRGEFPQELSPHWQSQSNQQNSLRNYVPLWVVAAVAGALLLVIFVGFTVVLDETTDPVLDALENIGTPPKIDSPIEN